MLKRTLLKTVESASKTFPVVLLTGPRQVGKTTLLEALATPDRKYVTLDNLEERRLAKEDPALFLQQHEPPVIIDEVQYAPELFPYIKIYADTHKQDGLFWLTGSQKFHLMNGVQESLAGRVAIIDLQGFSYAEKNGLADEVVPFLPTSDWVKNAQKNHRPTEDVSSLYQKIWEGSYPRLITKESINRELFFQSYVQTYIERDVKDAYNINNSITFYNFLVAIAARTGCLLNLADIARDIGVDNKTAKSWLSILEASGIVYLLRPYYNNITKRMIKTPKVYFLDTGLCAYLTDWETPKTLESGAMSGAILETYVVGEILKSYWHSGKYPHIYFYRDTDQKEVDCLIEKNGTLYPIEIKKTATPANLKINFDFLLKLQKPVADGAVLCLRPEIISLPKGILSIPIWEI